MPGAMKLTERIDGLFDSGKAPNLHGIVILQDGEQIYERYGQGEDYILGESLGEVRFDADTLHDVRSVSKSVVALLYGTALAQGKVPGPDEPLLPNFPEYPDLVADPAKARLTVGHALTMTLGLDWDESVPYTSSANSEIAMEEAPDRYRYVLERPFTAEPGLTWHYCGGATTLLGSLIAKGTGRPLEEYARTALFEPLGITFEWSTGADGVALAPAGLRLRPRDLAAIGQLVLEGGRDVVPGTWIEELLKPRIKIDEGFEYGYQWYVGPTWAAGMGNGGQRLFLMPGRRLVAAVAAGDYENFAQPSTAAVMDELVRE